jgi:hypothetical protein
MSVTTEWKAALLVSPLTVLVRGVLEWALPPATLTALFEEHAPQQQTRRLTVEALVGLLLQVVAGSRRSVFAAFQADQARDTPTIPTSFQALYAKAGRTEPAFATALVRHSAERLRLLLDQAPADGRPDCPGFEVRVWDGTDLDGTEHRLKVLRRTRAAGLPGRLVVEYDLARGLCVDAVASEDAYASEMKLVQFLINRAQPGRLYLADRNFCTWDIMSGLAERRARFLLREHQKLRQQAAGRAKRIGRVETGEVWEQKLYVEDRHTGQRMSVRRVIVKLDEPTRDGESEIRLLTNLPRRLKAPLIARLYRKRWTLESHFDLVKNQLHGEVESLGRPRAALLMMCLALTASNALAVVRRSLRVAKGVAWEDLSGYYLADEVAGNYRSIDRLVSAASWQAVVTLEAAACWSWCGTVADEIRPAAFQKHPRGPKKPPLRRTSGRGHSHHSTHRLLVNEAKRC